jgi:glycosyltransferase involved in cell wall biosynthesis
MKNKNIGIIIPVYNEAENIQIVLEKIIQEISPLNFNFTVIFVDDGSDVKVASYLKPKKYFDNINMEILTLTRNFGHQSALLAGLSYRVFDAYISMDGDLQHPPSLIPSLINSWENGSLVVQTLRISNQNNNFAKKFFSSLFYNLFGIGNKYKIKDGSSDFRLLDRIVVDVLNSIPERNKVLRGLLPTLGFKTSYLEFQAADRFKGKSKYSVKKMIRLAYSSFVSYSRIPILFALLISFILISITVAFSLFILYEKIYLNIHVPGQASILLTNLFTTLVVLISQTLIFIHVRKIHDQLQGLPPFVIDSSTVRPEEGA